MQKIIREYLDAFGEYEREILNDLRGYFKPSFFYIYLKGRFNFNLELLSIKDRGTFVHEYIHYIQNITTYWGLFSSITRYQELMEFKTHLISSETVEIPVVVDFSENLRKNKEKVIFGNGTSSFKSNISGKINRECEISIKKEIVSLNGNDCKKIELTIQFDDGAIEQIDLGAHIIKENMAAMYQSLVDAGAEHYDVPYNLIKILCEQHFSNISDEIEKLICICYISLFSMTPGSELISLLERASAEPEIDGMDIIKGFVESKIIDIDGSRYNVGDYFDVLVEQFKQLLKVNLQADLDYINEALERIKFSNSSFLYLTILYDQNKLSIYNLNSMVSYLGIPYIQTLTNGYYFPQSTIEGDTKEASRDVLELITQEAMFSYMTRPPMHKICPLYYLCSGTELDKSGCIGAPWKEPSCPFTIVSSLYSLHEKSIIWLF